MNDREKMAYVNLGKLSQMFPDTHFIGHRGISCNGPLHFEAQVDMDGLLNLKVDVKTGFGLGELLQAADFDAMTFTLKTLVVSDPWRCEECEEDFRDYLICELLVWEGERTLRVRLTDDHMGICEDTSEDRWRGDVHLVRRLVEDVVPYLDREIDVDSFVEDVMIPLEFTSDLLDHLNIATGK